jgi:hypothetical protein
LPGNSDVWFEGQRQRGGKRRDSFFAININTDQAVVMRGFEMLETIQLVSNGKRENGKTRDDEFTALTDSLWREAGAT